MQVMAFKKVDPKQSFPKMEEEILKFWEKNKIFEKSVEKNSPDKSFIFYEGPPSANGTPGLHHVLARAFKDVIPRYKTMKGYRVERKAGWDTHGLPVEIQAEKELGLKNKQEIENIIPGNPRESIIEFNKKCKESVWKYKDEWEKLTERMAYWVDMKNPYITYENRYIESVWWVVAQIFKTKNKKGESLIYKGHKVVPYCYRCGTTLSSHEVAQGYQKVKDNSIFVKFKAKPNPEKGIDDNTYFLVWTTTPWTLPGNVALAIGNNIDYCIIEILSGRMVGIDANKLKEYEVPEIHPERIIISKKFAEKLKESRNFNILKEFSGKDLLGLEYEPLYDTNNTDKKSYYVVEGDFVTTQEGTGIVHIAPAFGVDDSEIGKKYDLPTLVTVDIKGRMSADVPGKGILVKNKNDKGEYAVDHLIIEDLQKKNILLKLEKYEHDYPFCWRCDTPLIYYAKLSWFIRMSELSGELVKNNENINWIPEHIKEGRFGEWLKDVKDWAISRERYWGTPLPIWVCEKCGETKAVESIEEIREQLGNPNKLFLVRHGEAENNVKNILNSDLSKNHYHLTENGEKQIKDLTKILEDKKIDLIFSSPLLRARETAEIIANNLKLQIIEDDRLSEFGQGEFDGKTQEEFDAVFPTWPEEIMDKREEFGVETENEARERFSNFLKEINEKYKNKNIIIVSHGDPLQFLYSIIQERDRVEAYRNDWYPTKGSAKIIYSKYFDLHKPFIDDVKLKCACGGEMQRVPEVLDVWFDSGSMPLAQFHYPNEATKEDKEKIESGKFFPADYISEAIDQTRGWFYTLHAIATLLNKSGKVPTGYAYRNVICLGHILDVKGKKMSKSKGNVIDPMEVMDEYGADMLRWMLFTINQPGLPKCFDIRKMREVMNRVFRMLWNSYYFFVMYANIDKFKPTTNNQQPTTNLLDKWIVSELNVLIKNVDEKLSAYDIYSATGLIEKFIDNLSNWYIRRSRKRFWKSENDEDKNQAYRTLHYVLVELSKLMAPFTPFIAEEIYRNLTSPQPSPYQGEGKIKTPSPLQGEGRDEVVSVHLAEFPKSDEKLIDETLNKQMQNVRDVINTGLEIRASEKIKVRQPLAFLETNCKDLELFKDIIKEELNVKKINFVERVNREDKNLVIRDLYSEPNKMTAVIDITKQVAINTEITPELKLEGQAREVIRHIQEMRKEAGYEVDNRIKVCYTGLLGVFDKFGQMIAKETLADSLNKGKLADADLEKEFKINGEKIKILIKR